MRNRKHSCDLPALDKNSNTVACMNLIGRNSEKESHKQISIEPRHIPEVKQVLKCLAVRKCGDFVRILLHLTGISDFQARERATRKANSR